MIARMETDETVPRRTASRYSWYVLVLLFFVYVMNMADRQILGILAEEIKADLKLTDGQLGILSGPAIGFFYAVLGVPMAYAADRVNRVRFVAICLAIWSVMTAIGGRAQSLIQLAATRVGVSVAEAGGTPSSASLLADYFPAHLRGRVMAIWTSGSSVGVFLGFALGGVVNEALGWRHTFLVAGIPGIVLAMLIVLTVREPLRGSADERPSSTSSTARLSMFDSFRYLWRIKLLRQSILASAGCNFCVFSVLAWGAPYAVRSYAVGTAEAGTVMGSGIMIAGGSMMILAGFVSDILARKGYHRPLWVIAGAVALSSCLFWMAFTAPSFQMFAVYFTLAYAALMANAPVGWVIVQGSAPPEMRAMAAAIMLLVINILSSVPAPLLIGYLSDFLRPAFGNGSLGVALMLVPAVGFLTAIQFVRTGITARQLSTSGIELNQQTSMASA